MTLIIAFRGLELISVGGLQSYVSVRDGAAFDVAHLAIDGAESGRRRRSKTADSYYGTQQCSEEPLEAHFRHPFGAGGRLIYRIFRIDIQGAELQLPKETGNAHSILGRLVRSHGAGEETEPTCQLPKSRVIGM